MNKKQKLKKLHKITHILLLSLMVLGSVFGYWTAAPAKTAEAQDLTCSPDNQSVSNSLNWGKKPISFKVDRKNVYFGEPFTVYFSIAFENKDEFDSCKRQFPDANVEFDLYSAQFTYTKLNQVNLGWSDRAGFRGLEVKITGSIDGTAATGDFQNYLWAYVRKNNLDPKTWLFSYPAAAGYTSGKPINAKLRASSDPEHRVTPPDGDTDIPDIEISGGGPVTPPTGEVEFKAEDFHDVSISAPASVYRVSLQSKSEFPQDVNIVSTFEWGNTAKPAPKENDKVNVAIEGVTSTKGHVNTAGVFYVASNSLYDNKTPENCAQNDTTIWSQFHWGDGLIVLSGGLGLVGEALYRGVPYLFRAGCPNKFVSGNASTGFVHVDHPLKITFSDIQKKFTKDGKPAAGEQAFALYPVIGFTGLSDDRDLALVSGADKAKFTIKVFNTDDDLKADCKKEKPNLTADQLNAKNCSATGDAINASVGSNQSSLTACTTGTVMCFIKDVIVILIGVMREIVYTIFFYVVLPILQSVLSIRTYTDTFSSIIYPGWVIIRNVCNVFLILAMLIIGLATLFRVDGYNYKQLLVKVILAALFVNFSLVLGQAVLGIADTIQNQFLPNATQPLNQLGSALMVGNVSGGFPTLAQENPSAFADIVFSIFQLALTIGSFVAFCAITALLVVRLVALWILLMVSPVAWVADVLPATSKYRGEWWSNFLKYAFFAPIMGFFLNLTAVISLTLHDKLALITNQNFANGNNAGNLSNFIFQVASNVLLIAFLVAAVMVAQSFGIKGADAAVSAVTKGLKSPFGAGAWLGQRGLNYLNRKRLEAAATARGHSPKVGFGAALKSTLLAPDAFVKGWQKHQETLQHRAQERSQTAGREIAEQLLTRGRKIVPRTESLHESEVDEEMKNFIGMDRNRMVKEGARINKMGDSYDEQLVKQGFKKALMANGYWDDYVTDSVYIDSKAVDGAFFSKVQQALMQDAHGHQRKMAVLDAEGNKIGERDVQRSDYMFKYIDKDGNEKEKLAYNQLTRSAVAQALLGNHNPEGIRILRDAAEKYGKETGHLEYLDVFQYDEDKDSYDYYNTNSTAGDEFAAIEASKMDSRSQARAAWHSYRNIQNGDAVNKKLFAVLSKSLYENAPFAQERNSRNMITLGGKLEVETAQGANRGLLKVSQDDFDTLKGFAKIMPEGLVGQVQRALDGDYLPATTRKLVHGEVDQIEKLSPVFAKRAGRISVLVEDSTADGGYREDTIDISSHTQGDA